MRRDCATSKEPQAVQSDLLLHFNDSFDDAVSGRARVLVPNVQLFPSGKFDTCYDVGGIGTRYLRFDMSDKPIGSQDFTVDMWLYCTSYSSNYSFKWIFTLDRSGSTTGDEGSFSIRVRTTGKIEFSYRQNNAWHDTNTGITLPLNSWHHLCSVRANNVIMFFLDGVKQFETAMTARLMINQNTFVDFGNNWSNSAGNQRAFNGMIDELRFVVGTAAWTSNFTPPTEEYSV